MAYEHLLFERDGGVVKVTLNEPQVRNAITDEMRHELTEVIHRVATDTTAKVMVLTGAGQAFCAGGDVRSMPVATEGLAPLLRSIHAYVRELYTMPQVTIAAINGVAAGGGFNLALACDLLVASRAARFGAAFIRIGLIPDMGGLFFMVRALGLRKAKEFVFTGDFIDADEAYRLGVVNQVVEPEELEPTVMALAHRLAKGPTLALSIAKGILNKSLDTDFEGILEFEKHAQQVCAESQDHHEGVQAFLQKREARFVGR